MNCSKIIKNNKKNIVAEEDKKPFKVFYFAQIFEKLSVKFTDSFYFKDFTENMLNDVEKYNVNFIRNYEKKYVE